MCNIYIYLCNTLSELRSHELATVMPATTDSTVGASTDLTDSKHSSEISRTYIINTQNRFSQLMFPFVCCSFISRERARMVLNSEWTLFSLICYSHATADSTTAADLTAINLPRFLQVLDQFGVWPSWMKRAPIWIIKRLHHHQHPQQQHRSTWTEWRPVINLELEFWCA